MKTVRIDQLQIGTLAAVQPHGWEFKSEHPSTALHEGTIFENLEEANNLLADDCIAPALDLFMQITGNHKVCYYKIKIQ